MACSNWLISGQAVYSAGHYKISSNEQWFVIESIPEFYRNVLDSVPIRLKKYEKFFRIGEQSAITIAMALLAFNQARLDDEVDFDMTAVLGYGEDGSHHNNLTYWHDYVNNGKISAQGHLFVGTLASTPLCQLALTLGCHAPVYYISPQRDKSVLASELDFIYKQCENLFFIELKHDFCHCVFLQKDFNGVPSDDLISYLGELK